VNPQQPQPFAYAPTIDGFEVIDARTGRPVDHVYETPREANGRAQYLNQVAANGPRALARALRAS
jgi:hypothetical protein